MPKTIAELLTHKYFKSIIRGPKKSNIFTATFQVGDVWYENSASNAAQAIRMVYKRIVNVDPRNK